jgi:acetylornithine deacetylase/succinyl-diaminopimelate desuccinylase-like protein
LPGSHIRVWGGIDPSGKSSDSPGVLNTAKLNSYLEAELPAALELLRQMVGINSFTLNPEGVNRLARFTAESFAPLGFTAEYVDSTNPKFGQHLVLTRKGQGRQKHRDGFASRHGVSAGGRGAE